MYGKKTAYPPRLKFMNETCQPRGQLRLGQGGGERTIFVSISGRSHSYRVVLLAYTGPDHPPRDRVAQIASSISLEASRVEKHIRRHGGNKSAIFSTGNGLEADWRWPQQ